MLWLSLPIGLTQGWGICGRKLAREFLKTEECRIVFERKDAHRFENPVESECLLRAYATPEDKERFKAPHPQWNIQAIDEYSQIWGERSGGRNNIGISFNLSIDKGSVEALSNYFKVIAGGSSWCARLLRSFGLNAIALPQGIDPIIFSKSFAQKSINHDRFVIFSGGKYEFRKGQDFVIKAIGHLQQKYKDVHLVTLWDGVTYAYNSMSQSPHISHTTIYDDSTDKLAMFNKVLSENGADITRVHNLPSQHSLMLPHIYRETDVGIFPGRIEAGTNLVMMEYMGCGKPVIAPAHTGFADMISEEHALVLQDQLLHHRDHSTQPGIDYWYELSVDEVIARLEWAYEHRATLVEIGGRGADFVAPYTWERMAQGFKKIMLEN